MEPVLRDATGDRLICSIWEGGSDPVAALAITPMSLLLDKLKSLLLVRSRTGRQVTHPFPDGGAKLVDPPVGEGAHTFL